MKLRTWSIAGLFFLWTISASAQKPAIHIVKDHYTISGGLLGAANFSKYRTSGNQVGPYDYESGWSAGFWVNFPVTNFFSIEPQAMYSNLAYKTVRAQPQLMQDGSLGYIQAPLTLKFNLGDQFAFVLGPQADIFIKIQKDQHALKSYFEKATFSVFGGFEVFPHGRVAFFTRYIHGLTNNDRIGIPVAGSKYYNQQIQVGLKLKVFGKHIDADSDGDGVIDKEDACPAVFGLARYKGCPIPDTDNDGVNDEMDKCPSVPGLERYQGCPIPDTDKDGINDEVDKCPTVAGLERYQGCPIPDTDGDGINDEEDKCPTVRGLAKYQGCPIPDSDGDGINDEEDRCPNTPGVPEMKGCPKIATFDAFEVTFASGKSVLTDNGKKELDLVVNFLKNEGASANVMLVGHTDSTGSDKINDPLSIARANAAKGYLVSQGIDENRITTDGKGSHEPVADNKIAQGRQQNRRVEVTVQ